jgi:D-glycero-alpha-D-manno-heptose-7-phosphate kinase
MITTQTPFRISFFGGGSDIKSFYARHPGAVLSVAINKSMYITSHPYFEPNCVHLKYSKTELVSSVFEVEHPILRAVLSEMAPNGGLEVASIADIPGGTGLGSSSAFTVGLIQNLSARCQRFLPPGRLAEEACRIEIDVLGEPIGKQDQYAAAFGGMNRCIFYPDGRTSVDRIFVDAETIGSLEKRLFLFYLGMSRSASTILHEQTKNLADAEQVFESQKAMVAQVDAGIQFLRDGDLDAFGRLLHEGWRLKKKLASKISNADIDLQYERGLDAGALGGKVLGAGGGGFLLFYCPPSAQCQFLSAMQGLRRVPFRFEHNGSRVIHFCDEP